MTFELMWHCFEHGLHKQNLIQMSDHDGASEAPPWTACFNMMLLFDYYQQPLCVLQIWLAFVVTVLAFGDPLFRMSCILERAWARDAMLPLLGLRTIAPVSATCHGLGARIEEQGLSKLRCACIDCFAVLSWWYTSWKTYRISLEHVDTFYLYCPTFGSAPTAALIVTRMTNLRALNIFWIWSLIVCRHRPFWKRSRGYSRYQPNVGFPLTLAVLHRNCLHSCACCEHLDATLVGKTLFWCFLFLMVLYMM